jgi:hypothetical protein
MYVSFPADDQGRPFDTACLHLHSLYNGAMPNKAGEDDVDYLHVCGAEGIDDLIAALTELRGRLYPPAPSSLPIREKQWTVVARNGRDLAGGDCESEAAAFALAADWNERFEHSAPHRVRCRTVSEWVDVPAPAEEASADV